MSSTERKKIVYSDNGVDKAITGVIVSEDDFFYCVTGDNGKEYKVGKRAIVVIKDCEGDPQ